MAAKVARLVCYLLYRLLFPAVLLVCAAVRFNAVSFLYAVFLLLCPLLTSPNPSSIRGCTGIYLRVVFVVGLLAVLAHAVFHITLSAVATDAKPYGSMFPNCSSNEKLARQILLERLDNVATVDIIRLVLPDVVVFLTGLLIYIICYKLLPAEKNQSQELPTSVKSQKRRTVNSVLDFLGESFLVIVLAASGIIVPSVISALYFLSFICLATIWALYGHLGRKFNGFRILLLLYCAAHILVLHLYQFQFFQAELNPDNFVSRLLGLTAVVVTECSSPSQVFFYDTSKWPNFVNPAILVLLYYTLAFEVRRCWHGRVVVLDDVDGEQTERKHFRRRHKKGTERQVATSLDESQKEHLVDSEVRDYSSIEPVNADRSGSPTMLATDDEVEGGDEVDRPEKKTSEKRSPWVSALVYVMGQSYVLSLIAMMAWSITFHSWLTFVLLLAACCIWMLPNSRRVCYILSPIILFYGIGLLTIQYVYGMNLTDTELPKEKSGVNLEEIGLKKFKYPCLQLALQIVYTMMFWLTLRQYIRERRQSVLADDEKYQLQPVASTAVSPSTPKSLSEMLPENIAMKPIGGNVGKSLDLRLDSPDGYDSNTMIWLGQYVWCLLCKYWILLCAAMLLVISLQEVVVYRIIYMILFLAFVLTFQYAYRLWRATMFLFWWVIIVYSMVVLIMLYTYQFENVAAQWKNSTKLSDETLKDIGLEKFNTAKLFIQLLTPTSFLIFIIIQVHYFHKPFLLLSDLNRFKNETSEAPATPELATSPDTTDGECKEVKQKSKSLGKKFSQQFRKFWRCVSNLWETLTWFLWRLAEIHIFKVVAFVIIMVTTHEVSAVSAVYVILLSIFLPLTGCQFLLSHIAQFWTALVLLAKMIYQLGLVDNSRWLSNCTGNISNEAPFNEVIDNAQWVGMMKTADVSYYLRNYIGVLLILVFERIVVYHQCQYYNRPDVQKPKTGIIFSDIKRHEADEGIIPCVKYFLNYFFYKFGLELCYIMTAITISVRVDAFSFLYAVLLGILLLLSRRANARIWPLYTILLVILLPVQFLSALGLPLGFCYRYPWDGRVWMLNDKQGEELERWFYLPDYITPPNSYKLIADFFQLLFVCLQWRVFRIELSSKVDEPDGGNNEDITPEVEAKMEIPVDDFTTKISKHGTISRRSYLDVIKNFVFGYMFWVTLAIVFIAGTTRINLFSMGYVIAVFCFMWFGQEFLIKPLRKLVRAWNFLLGYCFFVLLLKAALQLPGCVYSRTISDKACWLVQLLGITCLRPGYIPGVSSCIIEKDNTGLAWDVVCFTFLLLQRRIYTSHYFRHIVSDIEAQNRLASRGCQLINRILMKEVAKQKEEEQTILEKIKKKMSSLKEKQSQLKKNYVEPVDHFQAIRSGDYYLFEESEDEDVEEEDELTTLTYGQDKDAEGEADPFKMISTAMTAGTEEAVRQEQEGGGSKPSSPKSTEPPGEGAGEGEDQVSLCEEKTEKGGVVTKIKNVFSFILAFLASCANWFTALFNRISRNYRLVAANMKDDHIKVKQQIQKEHKRLIEDPVEMKETKPGEAGAEGDKGDTTDEEIVVVTTEPTVPDTIVPQKSELSLSSVDLDKFDESEEEFEKNQPCLYRLIVATYYAIIARSEVVCYFLMILNHIMSASLLSLPLPMFVFLWGMLSVPRPTKMFWITVITYTEAVIVVKYLFQFGFFPWNTKVPPADPFWPPNIIGVQQKDNFAVMDLILLLALFIHRTILKRYGLWRDEEEESKPSKASSKSSIEETAGDDDGATEKILPETSQTSIKEGESQEVEESKSKKTSLLGAVFGPFTSFYKQLTCPDYSATTDVYAPMFACDFINFLIIVFGYQAFGPSQTAGGGDVTSYISEDRIPVPFLIMLLAQFILIIIDRALYLRKNVLGKFIFQILLVVLLHIWMFFILPYSTNKPFFSNKPAQLWYFIKCVYFALSAYQIRSAYPTRILGNFLTKKYNYVNLFLFKGFLAIPFLLELRTLMDWMWTNTTMAVGSWLQMEDIYANIYILKCYRVIEKTYPTPRAIPKRALIKYGVGGLLLFIIIFIIWFPLVIFSFANTVYVANPPKECTVSVTLAGYQPLFTISGQQQNIVRYSEGEFKDLKGQFDTNVAATAFLSNYEAEDVTKIKLDGKSTSVWTISPPSQKSLLDDLNNPAVDVNLDFHVTFVREPNAQAGETLTVQYRKKLTKDEKNHTAEMIVKNTTEHVKIANVFPKYIRLANKAATQIKPLLGTPPEKSFTTISIFLDSTSANASEEASWWDIEDEGAVDRMLTFITVNERVAPAGISAITGYGIIGLYISLVLVIGRLVRVFFTDGSTRIMFEELPDVDRILHLCLNLYLARECGEYYLEEHLFSKLLFLYRSTEMMIRFTKWKQD
ncbi:piezo-type mechanosensitive ion channel component 2-like isoform X3 [Mercenaria mercenaria]|uniref:piezo-type mechanosensitive ion channel component 2-like isoform X3 n=1 Tax=Mercenaria mercenaria TaxID=6596 RepID=UPI00234FA128|nr:piezo-type mechanosensitive ion channel component 2-like isoform X3 [Mercenaria mercenaria]